jgi:hypothetical protein
MIDIKISWNSGDTYSEWDEKCIRIIETFGLPGNKFTTQLNEDCLVFSFNDAEDALMAKLIIGG